MLANDIPEHLILSCLFFIFSRMAIDAFESELQAKKSVRLHLS